MKIILKLTNDLTKKNIEDYLSKIVQEAAEKLGTTTEYLWEVLVKQARYDIIVSVIHMAFMFAIVYWTIKLHIRFSKEDERQNSQYYYKEEILIIPILLTKYSWMK